MKDKAVFALNGLHHFNSLLALYPFRLFDAKEIRPPEERVQNLIVFHHLSSKLFNLPLEQLLSYSVEPILFLLILLGLGIIELVFDKLNQGVLPGPF